jgi:DegV family protein with EDD domain
MPSPIVLVTDSNGDVPADFVERYHIRVVPSILNMDGQALRDGVDISRAEFYRRLPALKTPATTAVPSAGEFEELYRACGDADIIAIHLSSKLSGFYNVSRVGAEACGARVTLIDSEQLSMGLGWQTIAAAEAIAAGKSVAEVVDIVADVRRRVTVVAVLDTLEYARRSGRVSHLKALMGELLQVKPMLSIVNGEVASLGQHRTRSKGLAKVKEIAQALGPLERLAIMHSNALDDAQALAAQLSAQSATQPIVLEFTAVLGTHMGPGAVGVGAVKAA